nr:hypothetical protein [Tanacetum cinerariifolium]
MKVDESIDKYKARLVIHCFRQKEGINLFDTYALVARISTIRLLLALAAINDLVIHQMNVITAFLNVSQLEYFRAIGCLMYAMISTRSDIAFAVGKLSSYTSNPNALHYKALGAIFWASRKQTCIPSSTMESDFVALTAAGNEAEWLTNLIYEIPLWPKPISTISIRCDSVVTLAKAYSQVYNGKSRHLGVTDSMIRKLIMNGVISVEFVRTQLNLADHLTKGLARDLVRKAAIAMGLKST